MAKPYKIVLDQTYQTAWPKLIDRNWGSYVREVMTTRREHLEMMCAAYLKQTAVDPARVVLIEQRDEHSWRVLWYFGERQDDGTIRLPDGNLLADSQA